jgi:8-oxo-dGTP diphosphatase
MDEKTRVAAMVIRDGKLLLLKGKKHDELWTPGGKIEKGETDEECLRRELKEEIGVELVSATFFGAYRGKAFYHDYIMNNRVYIAQISETIKPAAEIESFVWVSRDDFSNKKYPMIPIIKEEIIPDLIKQGVWK